MLAKIWNISSAFSGVKSAKLDKGEFVLAVHLSEKNKLGHQIPDTLPLNLRETIHRFERSLDQTKEA